MWKLFKPAVFLFGLLPLGYSLAQIWLLQGGQAHELGADPGKALTLLQGQWAIRFLVLTLLVSPLRKLTGWNQLQKVRRMLGLYCFFYASLHLSAYLVLLLELNFAGLAEDILERPYITVGFAAWLVLLPLAITSTGAMMRLLGRRWSLLHRGVYLVAVLAVIHVFWLARSSYFEAFLYGLILAILLLTRVFQGRKRIVPEGLKRAV